MLLLLTRAGSPVTVVALDSASDGLVANRVVRIIKAEPVSRVVSANKINRVIKAEKR